MPVSVVIANDRMSAVAEVPAGEHLSLPDIRALLDRAGVRHGLSLDDVGALTTAAGEPRRLTIARGTPPVRGEDALVEHLVDPRGRPQGQADRTIDLRELAAFVEVDAGEAIARLHPATPGTAGRDVRGDAIAATPGRDRDWTREFGDGVRVRGDDATILEAAQRGVLKRAKDGRWEIVVPLMIEGDVDFACGNIDTGIAVVVRGDVKSGFVVKSADGIVVNGAVEDARLSARGDLAVRGGILPGVRRVKAHGVLSARYVRERELKARDLVVDGELRQAVVLATMTVCARTIVGGRIVAGERVECTTLGAESGLATVVQVGVDPFARAVIGDAEAAAVDLRAALARIEERLRYVARHLKADDSGITAVDHIDARQLVEQRTRLVADLAAADRWIVDLRGRLDESSAGRAEVAVAGVAHPGVEILIGDHARLRLGAARARPRFRLLRGEIVDLNEPRPA